MTGEGLRVFRAVWAGRVVAEATRTVVVEGNHYFPPGSLRREYFTGSRTRTLCPWKGVARYYTLTADDRIARNAAWSYPHPTPFARRIKNHTAFTGEVVVEEASE